MKQSHTNHAGVSRFLIALLVLSTAAASILPSAAAATCPGGPISIAGTSSTYCTIQEALDDASSGQTVLVTPGTYPGSLTMSTSGVTLCSTSVGGSSCAPDAANTIIVADSAKAISLNANSARIEGFTIRASGAASFGIDVGPSGSSNSVIANNIVTRPLDNVGESGIRGRFIASVIESNDVSGFTQGVYFRPYGSGGRISNNTLHQNGESILLYTPNALINGNTFSNNLLRGIRIADANDVSTKPTGTVLRGNTFGALVPAVSFSASAGTPAPVTVDGRFNNWAAFSCADIAAKIVDDGRGNTVDFTPWNDASGVPHAPARLAGDTQSGECTIQAAITAASAGDIILIEAGTYTSQVVVSKAVTLCSAVPATYACASTPTGVTISPSSVPALSLTSGNVRIEGLTLSTGSSGTPIAVTTSGVLPNVAFVNNIIRGPAGGEATGIGGETGIFGQFTNILVEGNEFTRWRQGLMLRGGSVGGLVTGNTFTQNAEGVLSYGKDTTFTDNTFATNVLRGMRFGNLGGATAPTGNALHGNIFRDAPNTLAFSAGTGTIVPVTMDATGNDWGVYTRANIEASIDDAVGGNIVDVSCYVKGAGFVCPPSVSFSRSIVAPKRAESVTFTDTSVSGGNALTSWAWTFGDGGTSTAKNPVHAFANSGTRTVTSTVTDSEGFTGSASMIVSIANLAPIVASVPDATTTEGTRVDRWLTASDPDGDKITWTTSGRPVGANVVTFTNGTLLFRWTPSYTQSGVYPVTFIASDGELTSATTVTFTVLDTNAPPSATFSGPLTLQRDVVGTYTSFASDVDGFVVNETWTFSDGVVMWGNVISRAFASDGEYVLILTVTDNLGAITSSVPRTIRVDGTAPVSTITPDRAGHDDGTTLWFGIPITFSLSATDVSAISAIYFTVDGGPKTTYAPFRKPTVSTAGTHTIEYWARDVFGNEEAVKTLTFKIDNVAPTADIQTQGDAPGQIRYTYQKSYEIRSDVRDAASGVDSVVFFIDGVQVASFSGASVHIYVWNTSGVATGAHDIKVVARDNVGNTFERTARVHIVNVPTV